jgi:hypothetical protein
MILTEKAKRDFISWKNKNYPIEYYCTFTSMPENSQLALIDEWFQSVNINISISRRDSLDLGIYTVIENNDGILYDIVFYNTDKISILRNVIIKANEIYNNIHEA